MAFPGTSSILSFIVTLYLSTFVIFFIIWLATGVSIRRLGFSGLKRISYSPRHGIKIDISGIGFEVHRPTFAQHTWLSLVITELHVSVDLQALSSAQQGADTSPAVHHKDPATNGQTTKTKRPVLRLRQDTRQGRLKKQELFARLIKIKDKIKKLHRVLPWIQLIDVVAHRTVLEVAEVGTIKVGRFSASVDTRASTVSRSRLYKPKDFKSRAQRPAEWQFVTRSVVFTPNGREEENEVMDHCIFNVHGYLSEDVEGLRDASLALKFGRLNIPYDDVFNSLRVIKRIRQPSEARNPISAVNDYFADFQIHSTPQDHVLYAVLDAQGFVASVLRGIQEISLASSSVDITKRIDFVKPTGTPLYVKLSTKELSFDAYRLESSTPAHSMYFPKGDIAHQALLSALSISLNLVDGRGEDRLVYVPMITTTLKTTLPAKILQYADQKGALDWNTNVLFANLVITSPSIDLDPTHLPIVLALIRNRRSKPKPTKSHKHPFVSLLLPKLNAKLSIHEPVIRVKLPPVLTPASDDDYDFDLLVSSVSSIQMDLESSHSTANEQLRYAFIANLRVVSHKLYYQTASRHTNDLLVTDTIEIKTQVMAAPDVAVVASANVQTLSTFLIRPEFSNGIRQILQQLRSGVAPDKIRSSRSPQHNRHLRALPPWLKHVEFQASDFNLELAGVDEKIASHSRGFALHLDMLTVEYKEQKDGPGSRPGSRPISRRRTGSQAITLNEAMLQSPSTPTRTDSGIGASTDGRRIALHLRGLQSFIIESVNTLESKPFMSIPKSEIALSTSNDGQTPVLHINSTTRSVYVEYSLFRHYAVAVAFDSLRKTISPPMPNHKAMPVVHRSPTENVGDYATRTKELVTVDIKIPFAQIKAQLPSDPTMMVHVENFEAGRHRWRPPFMRSSVLRIYVENPAIQAAWSRVLSMKSLSVDLRDIKRDHGGMKKEERWIDVATEAIRIGIPHQLIVHHLFDNIINTMKTVKQLHHRFRTETEEYILAKVPEGPKDVPRVTIRSRILLFELEDGAFEWKLGLIYRVGAVEVKQRIAREEAFHAKCRKIRTGEAKSHNMFGVRSRSKDRARSHSRGGFARSPSRHKSNAQEPHASDHDPRGRRSASESGARGHNIRYDKDGTCSFSGAATSGIDEAWDKLQRVNSKSWKMRIDTALENQSSWVEDVHNLFWGLDTAPLDVYHNETILQIPERPALMSVLMSDLQITIDRPSFPIQELPDFMHRVGKGLPRDTKFSLLVPLHARVDMGETRVRLRDYPLPLLHIPSLKPGQSSRQPCWSLSTDFVVGEEYRNDGSTRDLKIIVVPPEKMGPNEKHHAFAVDVRRTVSPVKMYSDMKIAINTARDTHITWGTSYQPAIQDMMQVIEGFTKTPIDPSEKVGFWDKIRLSFHSRVNVVWKGDGDLYLMLKGSRDPYVVTGHGGGLVMIWRNNVRWNIRETDDPRKFMTVDSGDYVLAVPDFSRYARQSQELGTDREINRGQDTSSSKSSNDGHLLKKVVMKLSGRVRWQAGIVFERNLDDGGRSFEFSPHYNVTLKNPLHVKSIKNQPSYDAFRGFRSNHIHCSIAVSAPSDRDWNVANLSAASNYNSVHLSPRFFTHFFAWWKLFSGIMSLPVRQGPLFPQAEKSGKKFGRHMATIKYSLLFSPLYISHVYKHRESEEFESDTGSATGLKMRLNSFMLDLHQRREEFSSEVKGQNKTVTTSGMRINQGLLDLVRADLRAVSATIPGVTLATVRGASEEKVKQITSEPGRVDLSVFTISDNDFSWIDVDDFIEIDWTLPQGSEPDVKILPLAFAPRFTYRRQTDHGETIMGDPDRHSPFGYEPTHECIMSSRNNPVHVQINFLENRLKRLDELMNNQEFREQEQQVKVARESDYETKEQKRMEELKNHGDIMTKKKRFLTKMLRDLKKRLEPDEQTTGVPNGDPQYKLHLTETNSTAGTIGDPLITTHDLEGFDTTTVADHVSDFNNRFVVHNAQIKWNNSLRNCIMRYLYQVRQRRGFVYYTSRRAVKFILDIIEDQNKSKKQTPSSEKEPETPPQQYTEDPDIDIQSRIQQLLDDSKKFVDADDPIGSNANRKGSLADRTNEDVSHEFIAWNTYHLRLIAPQIQLQSEKNTKAVVLVTARGMRLKVVQIMDKDRLADEVSGLVQTRYGAEMDNVQFFVTTKESLSNDFLSLYAGDHYGAPAGSSWPPWAPMEAMYDFSVDTYGFFRVVQRTSASLRYDKYNQLRLKYNDNVSKGGPEKMPESDSAGNQMDFLWVDFPQLRAICDSLQYYAIYIIVLDLLMWSEPLEKTRHERLEKIMLASDFSDLRGAPEMVEMLQNRIRQLNEIKTHFHVNERFLDRQGWEDRISLEQDLASSEDELFFIMKAITTAQRKNDERTGGTQINGMLKWYLSAQEIVWHLTKEAGVPLAEFQLGHAVYERTDNSDGSNNNCVMIDRIHGLSLLSTATYPEIIAPYTAAHDADNRPSHIQMLRVNWLKLEAIAGINVVDHFEVNLFPLQIQLDYETGKNMFDYIFPGSKDGNDQSFSPFMVRHNLPAVQADSDEDEDAASQARREAILNVTKMSTRGQDTGAGSLDNRLQPTHILPERGASNATKSTRSAIFGLGIHNTSSNSPPAKFTIHPNESGTSIVASTKEKDRLRLSSDNTSLASRGRRFDPPSKTPTTSSNGTESTTTKRSLFHLPTRKAHTQRSASTDSRRSKASKAVNGTNTSNSSKDKPQPGDDLTQMLNRASNYMTLAYVKIPSVVLCLSYKGKGSRNFEDVHNLVFRMPTLEYRNKTWSNLDLALALKKDVIRALISHMGAIIGNKFVHHRPGKSQQSRLREVASSSVVLSSTEISRVHSATSAIVGADAGLHSDSDDDVNLDGEGSATETEPSNRSRSRASNFMDDHDQRVRFKRGSLEERRQENVTARDAADGVAEASTAAVYDSNTRVRKSSVTAMRQIGEQHQLSRPMSSHQSHPHQQQQQQPQVQAQAHQASSQSHGHSHSQHSHSGSGLSAIDALRADVVRQKLTKGFSGLKDIASLRGRRNSRAADGVAVADNTTANAGDEDADERAGSVTEDGVSVADGKERERTTPIKKGAGALRKIFGNHGG